MSCTLTWRDIFSFCGSMAFLGDSCHPVSCDWGCWREPSDADTVVLHIGNLHLGWCVYFWAIKTGFLSTMLQETLPPLLPPSWIFILLSFLGCASWNRKHEGQINSSMLAQSKKVLTMLYGWHTHIKVSWRFLLFLKVTKCFHLQLR